MTDYLTMAEVLAMHADQIERYGGSQGVRDPGLLEAALYRPQTGYYTDLIEEAAALWESLAQNHAFIDGNKRTAFAATYTFLAINGARLTAGAEETYAFVVGLHEANQFSFDRLVPWLRSHVTHGALEEWSPHSRGIKSGRRGTSRGACGAGLKSCRSRGKRSRSGDRRSQESYSTGPAPSEGLQRMMVASMLKRSL